MPTSASKSKFSATAQESFLRAKREVTSRGLLTDKPQDPTLDQARDDLAKAISRITHELFADRFGPLVGTITETSVTATLKSFENSLVQAKGNATIVIQEIADRFITSKESK